MCAIQLGLQAETPQGPRSQNPQELSQESRYQWKTTGTQENRGAGRPSLTVRLVHGFRVVLLVRTPLDPAIEPLALALQHRRARPVSPAAAEAQGAHAPRVAAPAPPAKASRRLQEAGGWVAKSTTLGAISGMLRDEIYHGSSEILNRPTPREGKAN